MDGNVAILVMALGIFQLAAVTIMVNCTSRMEKLLKEMLQKTDPIASKDPAQTTQ
jgi:hypothetical protein